MEELEHYLFLEAPHRFNERLEEIIQDILTEAEQIPSI